jgi:hypothetical protein
LLRRILALAGGLLLPVISYAAILELQLKPVTDPTVSLVILEYGSCKPNNRFGKRKGVKVLLPYEAKTTLEIERAKTCVRYSLKYFNGQTVLSPEVHVVQP